MPDLMSRKYLIWFAVIASVVCFHPMAWGQEVPAGREQQPGQVKHLVIKNDNTRFVGVITYEDAREVIIVTERLGEVAIPKHEIREIRELGEGELRDGQFVGEEMFATRYFLTTNGLPVKKGDSYIQWNLFGPDFQFGIADNFGVGVMTTWIAMPIVGTLKRSWQLGDNTHLAAGGLLGTGSWSRPDLGLALPFVAITRGNRSHNLNFSFGYGGLKYDDEVYNPNTGTYIEKPYREGRFLFSVAALARINENFSFVFDSFFMLRGSYMTETEYVWSDPLQRYIEVTREKRAPGLAVFSPGLRWQTRPESAFQFGFTGARFEGEFVPVPIPVVQWFRKI